MPSDATSVQELRVLQSILVQPVVSSQVAAALVLTSPVYGVADARVAKHGIGASGVRAAGSSSPMAVRVEALRCHASRLAPKNIIAVVASFVGAHIRVYRARRRHIHARGADMTGCARVIIDVFVRLSGTNVYAGVALCARAGVTRARRWYVIADTAAAIVDI